MQIEMSGIVCRYGETPAVDGVDLTVGEGEFLALLGPSGSGKTTLLRIMAGLEMPEAGGLALAGKNALALPPNKRHIGFVFQNYALFRHMTVARNIAFGLEVRPGSTRPSKQQIRERVAELLDLVQLPGMGNRLPAQLSGGQRQRVALARALAIEPRILLLDEPFGALDAKVRAELGEWLKALHKRLGLTIVFVTHDQEEAMNLAQRIVVMRRGRIEQDDAPARLYAEPASAFVYDFLGAANRLPCRVEGGRAYLADGTGFDLPASIRPSEATRSSLWFRPHQVALEPTPDTAGTWLPGTVRDIIAAGPHVRILLDHAGASIAALLPAEELPPGLTIGSLCHWSPQSWRVYGDI